MNIKSKTLKIYDNVREAARQRGNELNLSFSDYFEGLIFKDLELNEPELFKIAAPNRIYK